MRTTSAAVLVALMSLPARAEESIACPSFPTYPFDAGTPAGGTCSGHRMVELPGTGGSRRDALRAAEASLEVRAVAAGWVQVYSDVFLDGGTTMRFYARVVGTELFVAVVTVGGPQNRPDTFRHNGLPPFGSISFSFRTTRAPVLIRDFPLASAPARTEREVVVAGDEASVRYQEEPPPEPRLGFGPTHVPAVYGWARWSSPRLKGEEAYLNVFVKGDRVVVMDHPLNQGPRSNIRIQWLSVERGRAFLAAHPGAESR